MLTEAALKEHALEQAFLARHVAWGTDRRARWLQPIVQTADMGGGMVDTDGFYGNVQIEIGSNNDVVFDGRNRVPVYLGLCILNTSLWLDGEPIIERGLFVPQEMR